MKRDPTASEMYLMHQQGAAGGMALIQNPDSATWKALSSGTKLDLKAWNHIRPMVEIPISCQSIYTEMENFYEPLKRGQASAYSGDEAKSAFDQIEGDRRRRVSATANRGNSGHRHRAEQTHPDIQSAS